MLSVLIVEDDLSIADLLQDALQAGGYRVSAIVRSVEEAIASAQEDQPNFAVIDVHLADRGFGTDVGARLRETTTAGNLYSTGDDDHKALTGMGDAVIIKPYRMSEVAHCLEIIGDLAYSGRAQVTFPRKFRLLNSNDAKSRNCSPWG
jgi:DNA-binding response OmpR family regulator